MIGEIEIKNYKSISKSKMDLGRINVIIGENGAGKSNILEAIALTGAASAGKLDNEFLVSRGIRVTDPPFMRSAFRGCSPASSVEVTVSADNSSPLVYTLSNSNAPYSNWEAEFRHKDKGIEASNADDLIHALNVLLRNYETYGDDLDALLSSMKSALETVDFNSGTDSPNAKKSISFKLEPNSATEAFSQLLIKRTRVFKAQHDLLSRFVIYSPENSSLRVFEREGQIEPLGVNGEGLLKLLNVMSQSTDQSALNTVKRSLQLFEWFEDFQVLPDSEVTRARMAITDSYLNPERNKFDQRSANEGFLFLLFYFSLFSSNMTPPIFAVDNIDASLNPKMCEKLTSELVRLAKQNGKQVLLTTHNPAILDGLNLDDDEQRLFIVSRSRDGHTRIRRFKKPRTVGSRKTSLRLSEAFLRGSLGGLPKNF